MGGYGLTDNAVDILRDMSNIYGLHDSSVSAIYSRWYIKIDTDTLYIMQDFDHNSTLLYIESTYYTHSHTLEHNSFGDGALDATLQGILAIIQLITNILSWPPILCHSAFLCE